MSYQDTWEWADDYPHIVATIGPRVRVVVARNRLGWNFQIRRASKGRWFNKASTIQTRDDLARNAISRMHSGYVRDQGITQDVVDKALEHLPERFPLDTEWALFPSLKRPPLAASYKTFHDLRDSTNRDYLTDPYLT